MCVCFVKSIVSNYFAGAAVVVAVPEVVAEEDWRLLWLIPPSQATATKLAVIPINKINVINRFIISLLMN